VDPVEVLQERRNADGGFGPVAGAPSEPEATALVAIAADDDEAVAWLEAAQDADGAVGILAGSVFRDVTAVAAMVMRSPAATSGAIAHVVASPARSEPSSPALPHDGSLHGWSWTEDAFGWTEPTAWAVLALRRFGEEGPALEDGVGVLRDRECVGGGWNYGNRIVLDEALDPYVETTAVACLALAGLDEPVLDRGLAWLEASWRDEEAGLLSLAIAAAALRRPRPDAAAEARDVLTRRLGAAADEDTVALAWAAIALGEGLDRLEVG
jgi:hypothetical protein